MSLVNIWCLYHQKNTRPCNSCGWVFVVFAIEISVCHQYLDLSLEKPALPHILNQGALSLADSSPGCSSPAMPRPHQLMQTLATGIDSGIGCDPADQSGLRRFSSESFAWVTWEVDVLSFGGLDTRMMRVCSCQGSHDDPNEEAVNLEKAEPRDKILVCFFGSWIEPGLKPITFLDTILLHYLLIYHISDINYLQNINTTNNSDSMKIHVLTANLPFPLPLHNVFSPFYPSHLLLQHQSPSLVLW
jgi:hypothetical protein